MTAQSKIWRIATLGEDRSLVELLDVALARPDCIWQAHAEAGEQVRARAAAGQHAVESLADWEQLAAASQLDLILIAGRPHDGEARERRDAALRRFFQNQVPLVVVHPACDMILAYELEMIRRDTGTAVFPYVPLAELADSNELRPVSEGAQATGDSVPLKQWMWEHAFSPQMTGDSGEISRDVALDAFARDGIVIRHWLGEVAQVTGAGVHSDESDHGHLTVHLLTADQRTVRWTAAPGRDEERVRVSAMGGPTTVHWQATADGRESRCWQESGTGSETVPTSSLSVSSIEGADATASPASRFLDEVIAARRAGASTAGSTLRVSWEDVCRSLELTDGVVRSCQRRRTIDLYHEQVSEQATFKSLMAAGGCGMLMWVLAMLMLGGIVEGLDLPIRHWGLWRLFPLAIFSPLLVFLGLQLLQLVFPPAFARK